MSDLVLDDDIKETDPHEPTWSIEDANSSSVRLIVHAHHLHRWSKGVKSGATQHIVEVDGIYKSMRLSDIETCPGQVIDVDQGAGFNPIADKRAVSEIKERLGRFDTKHLSVKGVAGDENSMTVLFDIEDDTKKEEVIKYIHENYPDYTRHHSKGKIGGKEVDLDFKVEEHFRLSVSDFKRLGTARELHKEVWNIAMASGASELKWAQQHLPDAKSKPKEKPQRLEMSTADQAQIQQLLIDSDHVKDKIQVLEAGQTALRASVRALTQSPSR